MCAYSRIIPRLRYGLLTLCPAPTDPVPRGQLWPTGSVGDSVGEGAGGRGAKGGGGRTGCVEANGTGQGGGEKRGGSGRGAQYGHWLCATSPLSCRRRRCTASIPCCLCLRISGPVCRVCVTLASCLCTVCVSLLPLYCMPRCVEG